MSLLIFYEWIFKKFLYVSEILFQILKNELKVTNFVYVGNKIPYDPHEFFAWLN